MPKKTNSKPPRNYIGYFTLCQVIGGEIEDAGRRLSKDAIHAPVMRDNMLAELSRLKGFCDRATEAIQAAHKEWDELGTART